MSARRFHSRFLAYSLAAHLSPLLAFVVVDRVQPEPPPPPPTPVAITLLHVESEESGGATAATALDAPEARDARLHAFARSRRASRPSMRRRRAAPERLFEARTATHHAYAGFSAPVGHYRESERDLAPQPDHAAETRNDNDTRETQPAERPAAHSESQTEAPSESEREPRREAEPAPRRSLRERLAQRRAESAATEAGSPVQDRERAMAENRRRIDQAIPLTLWDDEREREVLGTVRVRFTLGRDGYIHDLEILEASDTTAVNHAAHEVLHLAEPLLYVPGPIEMELEFRG